MRFFSKLSKKALFVFISFYKVAGSPHMGGACRFHPSCSDYAMEALEKLPVGQASVLIFKRVLKCRPLGPSGFDPVPQLGELKYATQRQ